MSKNQSCSPTIIFRGALRSFKIWARVERIDVVHRLYGGAYETVVHTARIKMTVGDIGDGKARRRSLGRLRDLDKLKTLRNDQPFRGGDPGGNSGNMEKTAP